MQTMYSFRELLPLGPLCVQIRQASSFGGFSAGCSVNDQFVDRILQDCSPGHANTLRACTPSAALHLPVPGV